MSKKDFTRGMVAGARPFEDKFRQVEEAINTVGDSVNAGLYDIKAATDTLVSDISAIQKKELYDLNTKFDIQNLSDADKELLVAGLYTLAAMSDSLNDYQRSFIRSVQNYIQIRTPQTAVDLSIAIENIENISAQKAVLQVFMEFLFLEKENDTFLSDYSELFDFFNVNSRNRSEILGCIRAVYHATGALGISEKYGYTPPMTYVGQNEYNEIDWLKSDEAQAVWEESTRIAEESEREFRETLGQYVAPRDTPRLEGLAADVLSAISCNTGYYDEMTDDYIHILSSAGYTIHTYPHLDPRIKLKAITKYASGISSSDVIAVIDTSVMNSGSAGFLFTSDAMYSSGFCERPKYIEYKDIDSVEVKWNRKRHPYDSDLIVYTKMYGEKKMINLCVHKGLFKKILDEIVEAIVKEGY